MQTVVTAISRLQILQTMLKAIAMSFKRLNEMNGKEKTEALKFYIYLLLCLQNQKTFSIVFIITVSSEFSTANSYISFANNLRAFSGFTTFKSWRVEKLSPAE